MTRRPAREFALLADPVGRVRAARATRRFALGTARAHLEKARADARELLRRSRAARTAPGTFGPAEEALFDLVAESDLLPIVAPRGRLARDFAARCAAVAHRRLDALVAEREALTAAERLEGRARGRLTATRKAPGSSRSGGRPLATGEPESARAESLELEEAGAIPLGVRARLARLAARYPGEPEEGLAPGQMALPGTNLLIEASGRLRARPTIPGSRIILGSRLLPGRTRLRVATARRHARVPRMRQEPHEPRRGLASTPTTGRAIGSRSSRARTRGERSSPPPQPERLSVGRATMRDRLGKALAIVEAAWPEAAHEIRVRTRLVLPLDEPGLVSFSLPSRRGVSFLNLRGKRLVDLADDLLHETAHHRLHAIEDTRPLFRAWKARSSAEEPGGQEEPRFWSPWRNALRPVRGLFHAGYTFSFRAELFERIARAARASRGRVGPARVDAQLAKRLSSEARKERRLVLRSLRDLERAAAMGLLTAAGRRLLNLMSLAASPERRRRS